MADPDIFAFLYRNDYCYWASFAVTSSENASRCIQARGGETSFNTSDVLGRASRAETEEPHEDDWLLNSPCLGLKFSDGAQTNRGVVIGCSPDCDIVLPQKNGISRHHAALTFNKKNYLVVRDLGSLCGTKVIYNGEEVDRGISIDWIIEGMEFVKRKTPVLEINKILQFRLVIPFQNVHSQDYIDKVISFHKGTADAADLFKNLRTRSLLATEAPSRVTSKPSGPIFFEERLGEGSFSIVTHVINVSTGEQYARKEPKDISKNGYILRERKNEAAIMSSIQHVSTDLVQRIISLD